MEKLLREAGLEYCKSVTTPGVKEASATTSTAWFEESGLPQEPEEVFSENDPALDLSDLHPLDRGEMRCYRSAVPRCNYLAVDRFEIAFATKEVCRAMSKATVGDDRAVARLCRFLKELPRLVQRIHSADLCAFFDRGLHRQRLGRKSISGAAVRVWSSNQGVIALSIGEADYYAALKGASCAWHSKRCSETSVSRRI